MQLTTALALFGYAVAAPGPALNGRQTTSTCSTGVHMIVAPGWGEANTGGGGGMQNTINAVVAQIPGSDAIALPYPGMDGTITAKDAIIAGTVNMIQYIQQYQQSCPDTPIVLLGDSAGATITSNAVCGQSSPWDPTSPMSASLGNSLLAIVMSGDVTRLEDQPYNLGTCTGHGEQPRSTPSGCDDYVSRMQSYCDTADPECCLGNDQNAHLNYRNIYAQDEANFIVQKWNARSQK